MKRPLTIYNNWSSYDELSDSVPLSEELAMRELEEVLRLRSFGVRIDGYLMDAFWFDRAGGYRLWRRDRWPQGPDRWLSTCLSNGLLPGMWFTANTLFELDPPDEWKDSVAKGGWGLCLFEGGFAADFARILAEWYARGVRVFKFDFADFAAAPPGCALPPDQVRQRNVAAFQSLLAGFRRVCPEAITMAYNGFEFRPFMERTDSDPVPSISTDWLSIFDTVYSGDPRPADVPTVPFWRSVDVYSDHAVRVMLAGGFALERIDACSFMAGLTGTCYRRGAAAWKGSWLLSHARGASIVPIHGNLELFSDEDATWMAASQRLAEGGGPPQVFGGIPGRSEPYGYFSQGEKGAWITAMNPSMAEARIELPKEGRLVFRDAGFAPSLHGRSLTLGPGQMAVVASGDLAETDLGTQEDVRIPLALETLFDGDGPTVKVSANRGDTLRCIALQLDADGQPCRTWPKKGDKTTSMDAILRLKASDKGRSLPLRSDLNRWVWSGMSWSAAELDVPQDGELEVRFESQDANAVRSRLKLFRVRY